MGMSITQITEEQAIDMGIVDAAIRQAEKADRRELVMAPETVQLSKLEMQGRTMTVIANRVEMKYLGHFWWSV